MTDRLLIILIRLSITIGLCLILLGVYLHNFNDAVASMGVDGIIISSMCVAFGMVLSLPTKMYLTFLLVVRESEKNEDLN
ncbi:hypothetical protein [Shewanella donghaensis]|uniref:hypothetical protein n=1 Tax=Shewanella donghaensis TaxID=238836 RepID=UPI0011825963|nr:hypothetical protein [Shewanella donghaensis]